MTFEEAIIAFWHQSLVERARVVNLDGDEFSVRSTPKQKLKQVDFRFDGRDFRALEQNPKTNSRWAAMARKHQKVMQFLEGGKHVAVVVDGKAHLYPNKKDTSRNEERPDTPSSPSGLYQVGSKPPLMDRQIAAL